MNEQPGLIFGPWVERLTIAASLFAALVLGHRRIWSWGWQLRDVQAELERRERLHSEEVSRLRSEAAAANQRADEYLHLLLRQAGIVTETLPRIERRLGAIEAR